MNEELTPDAKGTTDSASGAADNAETHTAGRVPFTVEMMELDNNPIILQAKSY
ncbi:hypothetical protein [Streptomyces marincola]|uniref:hypothetical protein n=1 Tax=Streptomyces marincola TaxID=2878388 RepID=UPI001CF33A77|nr:hypothetical protein [Streptomyces marincola]UCM88672.1 hypothetical protein LC193_12300 [Streptomyces marincola]